MQAIEMEADMLFHLNYAIMLVNNAVFDKAREQYDKFQL